MIDDDQLMMFNAQPIEAKHKSPSKKVSFTIQVTHHVTFEEDWKN